MTFKLTPEQHDAVYARDRNILVSAAAGSGKTRVVVSRLLERVIEEKRNIDEFLVITFTNAAAAELRSRIESEIAARLAESPTDRHLARQLGLVAGAQITTIDSFCIATVREFSHLCDLSPGFAIIDPAKGEILSEEAMNSALEILYETMTPDSDFSRLVSLLSTAKDDRLLISAIKDTYDKVQSHPFPDMWLKEIQSQYSPVTDDFSQTIWGADLLSKAAASFKNAIDILNDALDLLSHEPLLGEKYSVTLDEDVRLAQQFISAAESGWEDAVKVLETPLPKLNRAPSKYPDPAFRDRIKAMRTIWTDLYKLTVKNICESSAVHLEETRSLLPAIRGLAGAVEMYEREYKRLKDRHGFADFSDTTHMAVRLLCNVSDKAITPSATAETLAGRYAEVMIDEYQDTNEVQNLLAEVLTSAKNNLFMVGDVKQSIYRFRLAEPGIFLRKYGTFPDYSDGKSGKDEQKDARIILSKNFRSRPEVIDSVNSVFEKLMVGGFSQIVYGENERLYSGRKLREEEKEEKGEKKEAKNDSYTSEFVILDVQKGEEDETDPIKVEEEAKYVAGRIKELLDSKFQVSDGAAQRDLRPSDIAILMKSVSKKARYFERALANLGIMSSSAGSEKADTAEILLMMSLLTIIDNAYQDIPLVGVMNSPIYGFTSDDLAKIRQTDKNVSLFEALKISAAAGDDKCKSFLNDMDELRFLAVDLGVDKLIRHIYREKNIPGIYSAMAGGIGRRRNLMRFYEFAVEYVSSGSSGIFGFVNFMERVIERGQFHTEESATGDSVRIMTIHKSKGMEFPLVFICDLTSKFNMADTRNTVLIHPHAGIGMKLIDEELMYRYPTAVYSAIAAKIREESVAEEMRVLYVAMTRAMDKLIMTCALPKAEAKLESMLRNGANLSTEKLRGADGFSKWLIPLMAAHPSGEAIRSLCENVEPDYKMPGKWKVSITSNISDEQAPTVDATIESQVESQVESPMKSSTEPPAEPPVKAQTDGKADLDTDVRDSNKVVADIRRRLSFVYPNAALESIPSKLTATELKGKPEDEELSENSDPFIKRRSTLRKPRFTLETEGLSPTERGNAIHIAVQYIDLNKCSTQEGVENEIKRLGDMRILSEEQLIAVDTRKITEFVNSDLGIRAFKSGNMRREFKFSILDESGRYYTEAPEGEKILLQGVCDLFFEEDDGIVVIDFKSDRVTAHSVHQRAEIYRPQIDVYAHAIEQITGKKVKEKALYFFSISKAITFI